MSDDESSQEDFAEAVSEILCMLHVCETSDDALEVLSAVVTVILCTGVSSPQEADEAYGKFISVIGTAMNKAEKGGFAVWTRGTSH